MVDTWIETSPLQMKSDKGVVDPNISISIVIVEVYLTTLFL
jgi:hypothetical protein